MPPEDRPIGQRLGEGMDIPYPFSAHRRIEVAPHTYRDERIQISITKNELCMILDMWPVYQQDDIGRRVVAIYDNPSSARLLQDMIDRHGYCVEPIIQAAPPRGRLRKIFGGHL